MLHCITFSRRSPLPVSKCDFSRLCQDKHQISVAQTSASWYIPLTCHKLCNTWNETTCSVYIFVYFIRYIIYIHCIPLSIDWTWYLLMCCLSIWRGMAKDRKSCRQDLSLVLLLCLTRCLPRWQLNRDIGQANGPRNSKSGSPATKTIRLDDRKKEPLSANQITCFATETWAPVKTPLDLSMLSVYWFWAFSVIIWSTAGLVAHELAKCRITRKRKNQSNSFCVRPHLPHSLPPRGSTHSKSILSRFSTKASSSPVFDTQVQTVQVRSIEKYRKPILTYFLSLRRGSQTMTQ